MCCYTRSFEKNTYSKNPRFFKICPTHRGQFSSLHQSILKTLHHRENGGILKIFLPTTVPVSYTTKPYFKCDVWRSTDHSLSISLHLLCPGPLNLLILLCTITNKTPKLFYLILTNFLLKLLIQSFWWTSPHPPPRGGYDSVGGAGRPLFEGSVVWSMPSPATR